MLIVYVDIVIESFRSLNILPRIHQSSGGQTNIEKLSGIEFRLLQLTIVVRFIGTDTRRSSPFRRKPYYIAPTRVHRIRARR